MVKLIGFIQLDIMPQKHAKYNSKPLKQGLPRRVLSYVRNWWNARLWHKIVAVFAAIVILYTGAAYGIAQWYIHRHANEPLRIGATFIPTYAKSYGLDPKETLNAILNDLGMRHLRLVSYWDEIEPNQGTYDFSELDWQFQMAETANAKVSLAIGLRQPRWPECHMPKWAEKQSMDQWAPELKVFMGKVIERYKNSPALETYQLENEFFMDVFGICPDHSRERLVDEFNFVKQQDPSHKVILTRSNNWIGIPMNAPEADQYGVSVYKRVYDVTITKRYFEYPLPPWFYATLAGAKEIVSGRDMIVHELQAEPWLPQSGYTMNSADPRDIAEQNKSMDAKRLKDRFEYGKDTGMRTMDMWGVEWWYWRKVKANDPSLWDVAKSEISKTNASNQGL